MRGFKSQVLETIIIKIVLFCNEYIMRAIKPLVLVTIRKGKQQFRKSFHEIVTSGYFMQALFCQLVLPQIIGINPTPMPIII